jgi:uncharacterized protein (DUF1330 family)
MVAPGHLKESPMFRREVMALTVTLVVMVALFMTFGRSLAQQPTGSTFVLVERTATTGAESIQEQYAKLARDILPKYGARYLVKSQKITSLEGDGPAPCCMAILEFPNLQAVKAWYNSPENQEASKIRQSGARFKILAIDGSSG